MEWWMMRLRSLLGIVVPLALSSVLASEPGMMKPCEQVERKCYTANIGRVIDQKSHDLENSTYPIGPNLTLIVYEFPTAASPCRALAKGEPLPVVEGSGERQLAYWLSQEGGEVTRSICFTRPFSPAEGALGKASEALHYARQEDGPWQYLAGRQPAKASAGQMAKFFAGLP